MGQYPSSPPPTLPASRLTGSDPFNLFSPPKQQAILSERVQVELEVRPKYLVADTNCYIDHLDALIRLTREKHYTLVAPLVGTSNLSCLYSIFLLIGIVTNSGKTDRLEIPKGSFLSLSLSVCDCHQRDRENRLHAREKSCGGFAPP